MSETGSFPEIDDCDDSLDEHECSLPFRPSLPSFLSEILLSVQYMQKTGKTGSTFLEIARFMKGTFNLTGDVLSQVETGLLEALGGGFVVIRNGRYYSVGPIARMQNASESERPSIAQELFQIFLYKSNKSKRRQSCGRKSPKGQTSEELIAILDELKNLIRSSQRHCSKRGEKHDALLGSDLNMIKKEITIEKPSKRYDLRNKTNCKLKCNNTTSRCAKKKKK